MPTMTGAVVTESIAVAVFPVPPLVEVTGPVTLVCVPFVVAVTLTENVHELARFSVAADRLMAPDPAFAEIVPPPHDPVSPFGVETSNPAGKLSVNATPARAAALAAGLVMVKLSFVLEFNTMLLGENDLLIVGALVTVRVAVLLVAPVPPRVELIGPVVLFFTPAVVPVTFTDRLQLDEIAPPLRLTEVALAAAVKVPPHVLVVLGTLATCMPLGNESLKDNWNMG